MEYGRAFRVGAVDPIEHQAMQVDVEICGGFETLDEGERASYCNAHCTIHLPNRTKDQPDRDRLALRYERFKAAA